MNTRAKLPSQKQLILPLLTHLATNPGATKAKDAAAALAETCGIGPDLLSRVDVDRNGQRSHWWQRHVRFARQKAQAMGYIASAGRGLWQITDEGRDGLPQATARIRVLALPGEDGGPPTFQIEADVGIPTVHTLLQADARHLDFLDEGAVDCIVTSVPYYDLKDYSHHDGQLASAESYEAFLEQMSMVLAEMRRVLIPGGRIALNCGDVLRSRKRHGTHHVLPLGADLLVRGRKAGLHALNGIVWSKMSNAKYEQGGNGVLGKPGQPNQIIKMEHEHILLMRKPGPYRTPTEAQRRDSHIAKDEHARWFNQVWADVPGARSTKDHPCPWPEEIPYRLARMFSFAGDTILDPCSGSGTTSLAAARAGRNSIGVDVNPDYVRHAGARLSAYARCAERERGLPGLARAQRR